MSFVLLTTDGEVRLLDESTPFADIQRMVNPEGKMVEVISTAHAVGESRLNAYVDEEARLKPEASLSNLVASRVFGRSLLGTVVVTGPVDRITEEDTGVTQAQLDHIRAVASGE